MMRISRSEFITVRGLRMHIRHWGAENAPKLFMLHGWMDVSASFQFVVDCLEKERHVIAPDWRGFGLSAPSGADAYWFPDYLADLDAILRHYVPTGEVDLLGHSMGGNIGCLYAGVRPERVARLVNLEGFGMPETKPEQAPRHYAKWLDEVRSPPLLRTYVSRAEIMARLQKNNRRLSDERADFLSRHWAAEQPDGSWRILGDHIHKTTNPVLYRAEEALACWKRIAAPVLWVEAADTDIWKWLGPKEDVRQEIDRRIACIPNVRKELLPGAGHMLHHDQPKMLAALLEDFLGR